MCTVLWIRFFAVFDDLKAKKNSDIEWCSQNFKLLLYKHEQKEFFSVWYLFCVWFIEIICYCYIPTNLSQHVIDLIYFSAIVSIFIFQFSNWKMLILSFHVERIYSQTIQVICFKRIAWSRQLLSCNAIRMMTTLWLHQPYLVDQRLTTMFQWLHGLFKCIYYIFIFIIFHRS